MVDGWSERGQWRQAKAHPRRHLDTQAHAGDDGAGGHQCLKEFGGGGHGGTGNAVHEALHQGQACNQDDDARTNDLGGQNLDAKTREDVVKDGSGDDSEKATDEVW